MSIPDRGGPVTWATLASCLLVLGVIAAIWWLV